MGLRGPIANLITTEPAPLSDLTPPDWLGDAAKEHWRIHSDYLVANKLLTTATAETWATCCDLWQRVCEFRGIPTSRIVLDTVGKYQSYAKLFRLIPVDKPGATPTSRFEQKKEFDG